LQIGQAKKVRKTGTKEGKDTNKERFKKKKVPMDDCYLGSLQGKTEKWSKIKKNFRRRQRIANPAKKGVGRGSFRGEDSIEKRKKLRTIFRRHCEA